MHDSFLLLTPFLVAAIVALLGFIGCDRVLGFDPITFIPQVTGVTATGGNMQVTLMWDPLQNATDYHVIRTQGASSMDIDTMSTATTYVDTGLTNNMSYTYEVYANTTTQDSRNSDPVTASTIAAVQFVQVNSAAPHPGGPPISVTLKNPATQGNCLIAAVSYGGPSTTSVAVSDDLGNSFIDVGPGPWFRQSHLFFLPNIPGGEVTITATGAGGATGPCSMCVSEYSGVDLTQGALYNFNTKASLSVGSPGLETIKGASVNLTQPGDMVYIVVFASTTTALTPAAGFTPHPAGDTSLLVEDSFSSLAATQTIATDDTTGGSYTPWVILAVGVKV